MRTFARNCAPRSYRWTEAPGAASAHAMAEKNPAAPPPMIAMDAEAGLVREAGDGFGLPDAAHLGRATEEVGEMKEDRSGETERIDAVKHASVAFDHRAPVFYSAIAFDGRHHQPPPEAEQRRHEGK